MIRIIEGNIVDAQTDYIIHQVNCQGEMNTGVAKALRDYEQQQKAGVKEFTFDPVKLGIRNATFWEDRIKNKQK